MTAPALQTASETGLPADGRAAFIEDFIGRTLMILWFTTATWIHVNQMITAIKTSNVDQFWFLAVAHSLLLITFSGLAALLTVIRNPTKAVASGIEPRISALLGTFLILTLPFLPGAENGVAVQFVALPITFIGLVGAIYCMAWLGRSFAIMAAARNLVTGGPYSVVRHPLYATELVAIFGVVLSSLSPIAIVIFVLVTAFQIRRTYNEERVLRAAFPEYEEYAKRVPRIIPRLPFRRTAPKPL